MRPAGVVQALLRRTLITSSIAEGLRDDHPTKEFRSSPTKLKSPRPKVPAAQGQAEGTLEAAVLGP